MPPYFLIDFVSSRTRIGLCIIIIIIFIIIINDIQYQSWFGI